MGEWDLKRQGKKALVSGGVVSGGLSPYRLEVSIVVQFSVHSYFQLVPNTGPSKTANKIRKT